VRKRSIRGKTWPTSGAGRRDAAANREGSDTQVASERSERY
jgi:hypothetical protein